MNTGKHLFLRTRNLLLATVLTLAFIALLFQGCKKSSEENSPAANAALMKMGKNLKAVDISLVASNMVSPLGLEEAPDGSKRLFVD